MWVSSYTEALTKNRELVALSRALCAQFHQRDLKLIRSVYGGYGHLWRKGAKGGLLSLEILPLIPDKIRDRIEKNMSELNVLAHIQGLWCLLSKDSFKLI